MSIVKLQSGEIGYRLLHCHQTSWISSLQIFSLDFLNQAPVRDLLDVFSSTHHIETSLSSEAPISAGSIYNISHSLLMHVNMNIGSLSTETERKRATGIPRQRHLAKICDEIYCEFYQGFSFSYESASVSLLLEYVVPVCH